jgi:uncharacterized protein YPO0396
MIDFERLPRALSRSGQIKSNERRHEKDDRRSIDDRSRYVLGWDNKAKIKMLRTEQNELRRGLVALNAQRDSSAESRSNACARPSRFWS